MYDICKAIHYLHSVKGIIHRDLKLENILMDNDYNLKIIDFGFSKKIGTGMAKTFLGTLNYLPPEVLSTARNDSLNYSFEFDIWGLGCILSNLLTGQALVRFNQNQPFTEEVMKYAKKIKDKGIGAILSGSIKGSARDLLIRMLDQDSKERIKIDQILDHTWFQSLCFSDSGQLGISTLGLSSLAGDGLSRTLLRNSDLSSMCIDSSQISSWIKCFQKSLNSVISSKISAAVSEHLTKLLDICLDIDFSIEEVKNFNAHFSLTVLRAAMALKKAKVFIDKEREVEINLVGFWAPELKKKVQKLQDMFRMTFQKCLNWNLEKLYKELAASVETIQRSNDVDQAFKTQLLENVGLLNSALTAKLTLSITPAGEEVYFKLTEKQGLNPTDKKKIMFRLIDMINSGFLIENLLPTQSAPTIKLEELITVKADFRKSIN
jgi:serine/threonine protein kinase